MGSDVGIKSDRKANGSMTEVPVGDGLLGRIVNALGEPIDDKGPKADGASQLKILLLV